MVNWQQEVIWSRVGCVRFPGKLSEQGALTRPAPRAAGSQAVSTQRRLWNSETELGSSLALSLSLDDLELVISPWGASVSSATAGHLTGLW